MLNENKNKTPIIILKDHKGSFPEPHKYTNILTNPRLKEFKENHKFKDPNFIPFRLTNPRLSRSKSPLNHEPLRITPKKPIDLKLAKIDNRDFIGYKTTTDFFSNLYLENRKLAQTFTNFPNKEQAKFGLENPLKEPEAFKLNIQSPKTEASSKVERFSNKILAKIKIISMASSILGENCFEIIDLLEKEKEFETSIKEYIKEMKFTEFLEIQQTVMSTLMKIFSETIICKVLNKEGEGLKEVGEFLYEKLLWVLENFKVYFNKYQELFSNMRLLQEKELKIEDSFHEGLYFLIDYYNVYYHENHLFGKAKPPVEAYLYSIQQFKRDLNKDSRNQKASKLYEDLELVLEGLLEKVAELKDDLAGKEEQNKKLSRLYEEEIKKNNEYQMMGLKEKRRGFLENVNAFE